MKIWTAIGLVLFLPGSILAQAIEVVVHRLPASGPVVPASGVKVVASQSPNQRGDALVSPVSASRDAGGSNVYSLNPGPLGWPIDLTVGLPKDYHHWIVSDVYPDGVQNQRIEVLLFHQSLELTAPQCFAFKTQFERLFRKEQQLAPGMSRAEIQHRARVNYADGLLALPNPNREHLQSEQTLRMLEAMSPDDFDDLEGMMSGLFDLYGMEEFERYIPSTWDTSYTRPDGIPEPSTVRLLGTHGTYENRHGTHHLEKVDISYSDQHETTVISGNYRFHPGLSDEVTGEFRWVINEDGRGFQGTPAWSGTLRAGPEDMPD